MIQNSTESETDEKLFAEYVSRIGYTVEHWFGLWKLVLHWFTMKAWESHLASVTWGWWYLLHGIVMRIIIIIGGIYWVLLWCHGLCWGFFMHLFDSQDKSMEIGTDYYAHFTDEEVETELKNWGLRLCSLIWVAWRPFEIENYFFLYKTQVKLLIRIFFCITIFQNVSKPTKKWK